MTGPDRLRRRRYPIVEHDPRRRAMIEPADLIKRKDVPEHCVLCFFDSVVERVSREQKAPEIDRRRSLTRPHPVYRVDFRGRPLAVVQPGVGAPYSAALMDELIAVGCRKFVACGCCGALRTDTEVGDLVVVSSAVRDEGTSYHYLPPAREVKPFRRAVAALAATLKANGVPYAVGKTWTTDGVYRETPAKVRLRQSEGCLTVEMEAAAMLAVSRFRRVPLGILLCAADDVSGQEWNPRPWGGRGDARERTFWLAAEACLRL